MKKIISLQEAIDLSKKLRLDHKTIVLAGGCFDILHKGHLAYLSNAKKQGDILLVALESDEKVKLMKGENRPVNLQRKRAENLINIDSVDFVLELPTFKTFNEYFAMTKAINPDIIAISEGDPKIKLKQKQAEAIDAQVKIVTPLLKEYSTTKILNRK